MKINWYLIVIALLIGLNFFQYTQDKPDNNVKQVKAEAKSIIDSLANVNKEKEKIIASSNVKIDSLTAVIGNLDSEAKQINDEAIKKTDAVSHYTLSELQQYFADRYGE